MGLCVMPRYLFTAREEGVEETEYHQRQASVIALQSALVFYHMCNYGLYQLHCASSDAIAHLQSADALPADRQSPAGLSRIPLHEKERQVPRVPSGPREL